MSSTREVNYRRKKKRPYRLKGKGLTPKQKMQVTQLVTKTVKPEMKHHDTSPVATLMSYAAPYLVDICQMIQDNTDTTRNGDLVLLQKIYCKFRFLYPVQPAATADAAAVGRVIIFQWREDNASAVPVVTDILQNNASPDDIIRPYTLDKNSKYRVLKDVTFALTRQDPIQLIDIYIDTKFSKNLQYTNSTQTGVNHIYVMVLCDDNVGFGTELPEFVMRARIRYTDS